MNENPAIIQRDSHIALTTQCGSQDTRKLLMFFMHWSRGKMNHLMLCQNLGVGAWPSDGEKQRAATSNDETRFAVARIGDVKNERLTVGRRPRRPQLPCNKSKMAAQHKTVQPQNGMAGTRRKRPLLRGVDNADLELMQEALQNGAAVNARDGHGNTPFLPACDLFVVGHVDAVRFLKSAIQGIQHSMWHAAVVISKWFTFLWLCPASISMPLR